MLYNTQLKQYLKTYNPHIYLYYLIFEIYVYISMHYNKQLLNGIFRFLKTDNHDYLLLDVENVIVRTIKGEG